MQADIIDFEVLKKLYKYDAFFTNVWTEYFKGHYGQYVLIDGLLFKNNVLCVLNCSIREVIIKETHSGSLAGRDKTLALFQQNLFWTRMNHDVTCHINHYCIYAIWLA